MSEEKQMYQETNERLLVELKKYELQTNIMQQQINANLSKIISSQTQELDSSNLQQIIQQLNMQVGEKEKRLQELTIRTQKQEVQIKTMTQEKKQTLIDLKE